jgi:hypothetical protein
MAHLLVKLGEAALRPHLVGGSWHKPVISGRIAALLRKKELLAGRWGLIFPFLVPMTTQNILSWGRIAQSNLAWAIALDEFSESHLSGPWMISCLHLLYAFLDANDTGFFPFDFCELSVVVRHFLKSESEILKSWVDFW